MKGKPMTGRISAPLPLLALAMSPAWARDDRVRAPKPNARPLSGIIALVEKREGLSHVEEIERDEDGFLEVAWHEDDRARVEIAVNTVTGDPG
jgi:hypothetical protein